jgi:hypothetical protein
MTRSSGRGVPRSGVPGEGAPPLALYLIALPAAVAVWSGRVGLGQLCGFGMIQPLPGIWDSATVNTAITLPIGVEAYGSYALAAWLDSGTPKTARTFAKWSAIGALTLGMLGQVAYHLLSSANATRAPESAPEVNPDAVPEPLSALAPESAPERVPVTATVGAPKAPAKTALRAKAKSAVKRAAKVVDSAGLYATELAAGELPSLRRIRADMHVGQPRAQQIQAELAAALGTAVAA